MKIKFLLLFFIATFFCSNVSISKANEYDMAAFSCKDYNVSTNQEKLNFIFWIDGYQSALSENTILTDEWLSKLISSITTYCSKNPNATVFDAMNNVDNQNSGQ